MHRLRAVKDFCARVAGALWTCCGRQVLVNVHICPGLEAFRDSSIVPGRQAMLGPKNRRPHFEGHRGLYGPVRVALTRML